MDRRGVLTLISGLAGVGALGGCLGNRDGSGDRTVTTSPPPTVTPTATAPGGQLETSFAVLDRACGSRSNQASVTFDTDSVEVSGLIGGRDTCDTARLASADLDGDGLEIVVEAYAEPHTEPVACAECLTDIEYVVRATGGSGGPTRVRVIHDTLAGREVVTVADRP